MYNIYSYIIFHCLKNSFHCSIFSRGNMPNEQIRTSIIYFTESYYSLLEFTFLTVLKGVELYFRRQNYPRPG